MMDSMDASEADQLKTGRGTLSDIWSGFILPKRPLDKVPAGECGDDGPPRINSQGARNASVHAPSSPAPPRGTVSSESSKSRPGKPPQEQIRDGKRVLGQTACPQERTFGATFPNPETRGEIARNLTWSCLVCTLDNELEHLACSACATPRGDTLWQHPPSDHI